MDTLLRDFSERFFSRDGSNTPTSLEDLGVYSEPVTAFVEDMRKCEDWESAHVVAKKWRFLAPDTLASVEVCREKYDFKSLIHTLRTGKMMDGSTVAESHLKDGASIIVPKVMVLCSMISREADVPWGVAFIQGVMAGKITITDGVAKAEA